MHATVHHSHADGRHYPDHACPIYAAFRDGAVRKVDTEVFWRKDGTPFHVEYSATPIREGGRLRGAVIVFGDITARREEEERLRNALAEIGRLRERLERENEYLRKAVRAETHHRDIIGRSAQEEQDAGRTRLMTEDDRRQRDRDNIAAALRAANGRIFGVGGAAELLRIRPTTLISRIKALGVKT